MLLWQPFLAFYIWGAHWRHLKNTTEPSVCGGDAALCQITLTTCFDIIPLYNCSFLHYFILEVSLLFYLGLILGSVLTTKSFLYG